MKIKRSALLTIYLVLPLIVWAHPHVFITVNPTLVFDEKGFRRAEIEWVFDEMYSFDILMALTDGDNVITREEGENLETNFINVFGEFGFHTHFIINDQEIDIQEVFDLEVEVNEENLVVMSFITPMYIPLESKTKSFIFALYDETRYYALLPDNGVKIEKPENIDVSINNKNKITFNVAFKKEG